MITRTTTIPQHLLPALGPVVTLTQLRGFYDAIRALVPDLEEDSVEIDVKVGAVRFTHTLSAAEEVEHLRGEDATEEDRVKAVIAEFSSSRSREVWALIAGLRTAMGIAPPPAPQTGTQGPAAPPVTPHAPGELDPSAPDKKAEFIAFIEHAQFVLPGHEIEIANTAKRLGLTLDEAFDALGRATSEREAFRQALRDRGIALETAGG